MPRAFLFILCSTVVFGQLPQRDPIDNVLQSHHEARQRGDFDAAAARREEARAMLTQSPLSLQWANRVEAVARVYQGSGRSLEARAIVQEALSRADSPAIRIQLLNTLADFWQQDGNLLKALSYREKALAAHESAPASTNDSHALPQFAASRIGSFRTSIFAIGSRPFPGSTLYHQLSELYGQLGRREAANKILEKYRSLIQDKPRDLAAFYAGQGQVEEATALYRKLYAQAAANPQAPMFEVTGPLQAISNLYQSQQRFNEAAAALQQAVTIVENSTSPEARSQLVPMRLNLASLLQQDGHDRAADQLYQALLAQTTADPNRQQLQVVQAYASQLARTNRASQGEDLLKKYLASNSLEPWEEANIYHSLSQIARGSGRKDLAEEYQRTAMEKQGSQRAPQSEEGVLIGPDLEKALQATRAGNREEALALAARALELASLARDRERVVDQIPTIANILAAGKPSDDSEALYRRLIALTESWSVDDASPLPQVLEEYVRFLGGHMDRWPEVPAAIERYRQILVETHGVDTSALERAIERRMDFARGSGAQADAVSAADELLAFEASLSGNTSQHYLRVAQRAATIYRTSDNPSRELALYRQMIAIADVAFSPQDEKRAFCRMDAAFAFARARRFEEAESLVGEAVTLSKQMRPLLNEQFTSQAEQIHQMKAGGQTERPSVGKAPRVTITAPHGWFDRDVVRAPLLPSRE